MATTTVQTLPNQVPSLIIPLERGSLLVPNSCVAEIISYTELAPVENAPEWQVGNIQWREIMLPCISFEKLKGETVDAYSQRDRIAIFNTITDKVEKRFYGMIIRGIPRLARIVPEDLVEEERERSEFEKASVQINGEPSSIPDLEAIEKMVGMAI
jgi:chemosensory pili system protein ChpC